MLATALAQLRVAASILFGVRFAPWSLDQIVDTLQATRHEFGDLKHDSAELLVRPALDDATRREMQLRRFRKQAVRAARETTYYRALFAELGLDPARLTTDDIPRLPLTPKEALKADPDAFVRRSVQGLFRTTTTGTTGVPTHVCFSSYELRTYVALAAIGLLSSQTVTPEDIVQISASARAGLGLMCFAGGSARIGAQVQIPGVVEPRRTLGLLQERRRLAGKKSQVSVLQIFPSYLGEVVEYGLQQGLGPHDFGLEHIIVGGEICTAGLKARCHELFGEVRFEEGYGMTEPWPFGGTQCEDGHLHFEPSAGLMEIAELDRGAAAVAGDAGRLVLTPFPPYREATLLLRYDTEDVVRPIGGPLACSRRHEPATSRLFGKLRLSVQHEHGWTFPRDVLEALETVHAVALPARCGFWAVPGGVAVEVVARDRGAATRRTIERSLEQHGVPVRELYLRRERDELCRPLPLRGDLRDGAFDAIAPDRRVSSIVEVSDQLLVGV